MITIAAQERQRVLDRLASSERRLLALVDGLSPEQWNFRESPDRWSIAENIDHLALFENFILQTIRKVLDSPAEPHKKARAAEKEPLVLGLANSQGAKFKAREIALPTSRWPDTSELLAEFRKIHAQIFAFAEETQADLRDHFFPHIVFGDLDCYQWLVVLGEHGARHTAQIERIKSHPSFPA